MAEFLIRCRDKEGHNAMCRGEHEVVVVCPDGWGWSDIERSHPEWRIVRVPGVTVADAKRWSVREAVNPNDNVQRPRHFKLVPARWASDVQAWYADDSRRVPVIDMDAAVFDASFRSRVPLPRLGVIAERGVIG